MNQEFVKSNRRLERMIVMLGVVLAVLVLVIGWGGSYQSCVRSNNGREVVNARNDNTSDFFEFISGVRRGSSSNAQTTLEEMEKVDGEAADVFRAYLGRARDKDAQAAASYQEFADKQRAAKIGILNCAQPIPQTSS